MQYPMIHINGSHGPTLLGQYMVAIDYTREALKRVDQIDLHARDYYPIGSGAYAVAAAQHNDYRRKLQSVLASLEAIALNIDQQLGERLKERS